MPLGFAQYSHSVLIFALGALAAGSLWDALRRHARFEREVRGRTQELNAALQSLAQANQGLEESEQRYRCLVEQLPLALVVECQGKIVLANHAAQEMFGVYPARDQRPRALLEFVPVDQLQESAALLQRLRDSNFEAPPFETLLRRQDGTEVEVEVCISSGQHMGGARCIQAVLRDISRNKQREAENSRLIQAIEQAAESFVITDAEARIVYVNPAFERISGYSRQEAIGQNPRMLKSGYQPEEFYLAMWEKLVTGASWSGRFVNRRKDGSTYIEEATISPVVNREGRVINYVAVKRHTSVEPELQEKLQQAQKMEAIGRLAGGVAHDFNNMLMVINSYTELLAMSLAEDDERRKYTEKILRATERSAGLTRQLLTFGRKQIVNPVVMDCNTILTEMSNMVRRLIAENIDLHCTLSPGLWRIKADPDQMVQVILNLCVNARDAMPRGGLLTLSSRNHDEGAGFVELAVTDTGIGIPYEARAKLFDPFYTTKPAGKGTGLGLSIVYGIVQQLGGYIRVESEPGKGAAFRVFLPTCAEVHAADMQTLPADSPADSCMVLLVEDEEALRVAIAEQLRCQGYRVVCATNGEEALVALSQHAGVHVLITDLVMPRMGGRDLVREASRRLPGLRIMLLSGYAEEHMTPIESNGCPSTFLQKPFTLAAMMQRLAELRAEPHAPQPQDSAPQPQA